MKVLALQLSIDYSLFLLDLALQPLDRSFDNVDLEVVDLDLCSPKVE
jgi:hypothetical protein